MANRGENLSKNLSANLIHLRRSRALTQGKLAQLAQLPRSTVTHIESGGGNPSLSNLVRISTALQVSIDELLAPPRSQTRLIKATELPVVRRSQGAAQLFKLLPDPIPGMEMDRMEIEIGARFGGVPHVSGTREYLTCLQGEVTVAVGGQSYRVQAGDVFAFQGDQAHSYQNTGTKKAICVSVVVLAPVGVILGP